MPLLQDVPDLGHEKFLRLQVFLRSLDSLWSPPAIQQYLCCNFLQLLCYSFPETSLHRSWIQLRIHRDSGSIRTWGRGLPFVLVSWTQTNWLRLGYRRFSFRLPFLNSLRHDGCLFNWTKMAAREHGEIHDVEQTKKIAPFITRRTSFGRWFLVSTYLIWILGSKLILSYLTRFCAFWIRVSSLDFVLCWSSWSLPRCLQECTAVCYIERNLHLWPRDRNLTTHQHSGFLLSSNWRLMCLLQFPANSWLCLHLQKYFGLLVYWC